MGKTVTYCHKNHPNGLRFRQYVKDPLPEWAVDVKEEEDLEEIRLKKWIKQGVEYGFLSKEEAKEWESRISLILENI